MSLTVNIPQPVVVANGGTGLTVGTSGGVPYFSSTTAMTSSAALAQYGVVLGGGAGAAPVTLATDSSTTKVLTSGGSSANPSWAVVPFGLLTVASKTTTFSTTATDNVLKCDMSGSSNASYTGTLHTAVGNTGQILIFEITAGTGVLTLATTSSQTIFIVSALASTVVKMATIGDTLTLVSDGTNWICTYFGINCGIQYTGIATGTINAGFNKATLPTKVKDPLSQYSSGVFTAIFPGTYLVSAMLCINATNSLAGSNITQVIQGGSSSQAYQGNVQGQSTANVYMTPSADASFKIAAGDTLTVNSYSDGTSPGLSGNANNFIFSVVRTGP